MSLGSGSGPREQLPQNVESIFIKTSDSKQLELWRLPVIDSSHVVIIFHGNAGDVANFFPYQQYFEQMGFTSYGVDYRGFGRSTGWPFTERGIYLDADASIEYVLNREQITAEQLILTGISIGSGPASYLAKNHQPQALILYTPFTTLPEMIKTVPLFGLLYNFSFYEFPVKQNVSQLINTCLLVIHGKRDEVIPFSMGEEVFKAYSGASSSQFIVSETARHNDLLFRTMGKLKDRLNLCIDSF